MDYITEINNIYVEKVRNESIKRSLGALGLAATLAVTPSFQATGAEPNQSVAVQSSQSIDYNDLRDYITKEEGKGKPGKPGFKYTDINGHPTIGYGHLITNKSKGIFKSLFNNEERVTKLLSGEEAMTDAEMDKLFDYDVKQKINYARKLIPSFNTYPQYVKNAIISALYRGDIGPKTRSYINKGEWEAAAKQYLRHDEYIKSSATKSRAIAKRMERNQAAFLKYAKEIEKQKEVINKPTTTSNTTYKIKKGDSLYKISKELKIPLQALIDANPGIDVKNLKIGQEINLKSNQQNTYVIKQGDTLYNIASKFKLKVSDITSKNPNINSRNLKIGQKINL